MIKLLDETYPAKLENIRVIRQSLRQVFAKMQLNSFILNKTLLTVSEWLSNLLRHADDTAAEFQLTVTSDTNKQRYFISIYDNGAAFTEFDNATANKSIPDAKQQESGYGLYLIKTYFPDVKYYAKTATSTDANIETHTETNTNKLDFNQLQFCLNPAKKIAIIEDDRASQLLLQNFLQTEHDIRVFSNGKHLLDELASTQNNSDNHHNYDLIISDISMPDVNGISLKQQLSQHQRLRLVPFIFLTASQNPRVKEQAFALGIDDYLVKPINKATLLNTVNRTLQHATQTQQQLGKVFDQQLTALLRPELPNRLSNYDCALVTKEATAGGGDFLIHQQLAENNLILLGDVMGHGKQAKFYAHMYAGYLQGILNSMRGQTITSPAKILAQLSEAIANDQHLESVIVTFVAVLLQEHNTVTIANAGHPQPILLQMEQATEKDTEQNTRKATDSTIEQVALTELAVHGPLPGLGMTDYQDYRLALGTSRLILYTDGLFESLPDYQPAAAKQIICNKLTQLAATELQAAAQDLANAYDGLCHNQASDDMTVIFIEQRLN